MTKAKKDEFYVSVNPIITTVIVLGLFYLLPCVAFKPEWLPPSTLTGYFGDFLWHLTNNYQSAMRIIFYVSILIHLLESVTAMVLCVYLGLELDTTAKWGANVFVHGLFALKFLIRRLYEEERDGSNKGYQTVINYDKIR